MGNAAIEILLVEDDPEDVRLTKEGLREGKICNKLNVVSDGAEALAYLRREGPYSDVAKPDIILLDLNLPRISGYRVLEAIKSDESLKHIPVVVLTASESDADVLKSYTLHANCYISKPVDFDQFTSVIRKLDQFWFAVVRLPANG